MGALLGELDRSTHQSESEQSMGNVWLSHDTEQHMSESGLEVEFVGEYRFSFL